MFFLSCLTFFTLGPLPAGSTYTGSGDGVTHTPVETLTLGAAVGPVGAWQTALLAAGAREPPGTLALPGLWVADGPVEAVAGESALQAVEPPGAGLRAVGPPPTGATDAGSADVVALRAVFAPAHLGAAGAVVTRATFCKFRFIGQVRSLFNVNIQKKVL